MNHVYLIDVIKLKSKISKSVKKYGGFYSYTLGLSMQSQFSEGGYARALSLLKKFYSTWNLDKLHTWDIPCPIEPSIAGGKPYGPRINQAGIHIFLPWYSVKGKLLNLDVQVKDIERLHLDGRFSPYFETHNSKSYSYHEQMFWFYRYFFLAIYARYKERLKGNLEKLDGAFRGIIGDSGSAARIRKDFIRQYKSLGIIRD